jgi:predicted transcriptional regulator
MHSRCAVVLINIAVLSAPRLAKSVWIGVQPRTFITARLSSSYRQHMSADDPTDDESDETVELPVSADCDRARERIEESTDKAFDEFDERVVDLLTWILDTETRARIYGYLRQNPGSTSEEVAEGTGLYPSTVREALAELHEDETVTRTKREHSGAGNNPYEYRAIAPSELVSEIVDDVQRELNTVFNLDRHLGGEPTPDDEPIKIVVSEDDE